VSVAEGIECWGRRSTKKARVPNDHDFVEHIVYSQDAVHVFDGRYHQVVDNEERPSTQVGIYRIVLKLGEWIAVWTI
jgi:hypothetical protein